MIVLGVETSCDETAAAIVAEHEGKLRVLAERVASQVELHARFGGVVPEIASRAHLEALPHLVKAVLDEAGIGGSELDEIAVTQGPGLVGALLVGTSFARAFGAAARVPVRPVHHLEAHLFAPLLAGKAIRYPMLTLLVSGGHTMLVVTHAPGEHEVLGQTLDDAAGECLDKAARVLGLGYPGGPAIARLAKEGDPARFALPRPMRDKGLDFSFSGLKTAIVHAWAASAKDEQAKKDLAAAVEAALVDVLVAKTMRALEVVRPAMLVAAGGVAANERLRRALAEAAQAKGVSLVLPPLRYCTDNAAMVAAAGIVRARAGLAIPADWDAAPRLALA